MLGRFMRGLPERMTRDLPERRPRPRHFFVPVAGADARWVRLLTNDAGLVLAEDECDVGRQRMTGSRVEGLRVRRVFAPRDASALCELGDHKELLDPRLDHIVGAAVCVRGMELHVDHRGVLVRWCLEPGRGDQSVRRTEQFGRPWPVCGRGGAQPGVRRPEHKLHRLLVGHR